MRIEEWRQFAKKHYPEGGSWFWDRYAKLRHRLEALSEKEPTEFVTWWANQVFRTTRSPGKIQAIHDWREAHADD